MTIITVIIITVHGTLGVVGLRWRSSSLPY